MTDPVNAADVLAESEWPCVVDDRFRFCADDGVTPVNMVHTECVLAALSKRAGGGAFACMPDGGGWTLLRIEYRSTVPASEERLYRLVPVVDNK